MFTAKSSSPTNSNYDFTLRHERVKLLGRVLKQFDGRISRTAQAMREVASCLSLAGQSYHEVVQCVNNTNPQTSANQTSFISFSNGLAENHGVSLRSAATLFAAEMKSIKDGEQYLSYDIGVHQTVLARLQEVLAKVHETRGFGDEVEATFKKFMSARNVVHKKEAKYMRKGRPLTDSKRYVKQCDKMHKKEQIFQAKLNVFDMEYDSLMQRQLYVAGHTMDDFLDVNTVYLSHMLKVLGCLAPHGAETIERMVNSGEKLSECIGVAPADQFGSRLRTRGVGLLESDNVTPIKVSDCTTTPGRGVPAKSSRTCRSHNFTTYYENRRQTTASADRAPPTTRALDGEGDENSTPGCPLNQTPQRQPVLNPTPLRAPFGVTEGNRQAESDAYLAGDSNPSPPPKPPSFPASARHTHLLAVGTTAACEAPGTAAGAGKQTSSMKRERPTTASVVTNADDSRRACDAATTGITRKVAHGHAPFGGSATPAFPSPAAAGAAKSSTKRPKGRPTLEFDPARSAEPFFDDTIASLCKSTPRKSLQPIALFPLDFDEDCIPQKVTSRISTSTTVSGSTVTLQRPRRRSKNFTIASAASASRGGALQSCIASAPPDEDTLTSSTNTNLQGSEKSIRSPRATHGHRPQPHVFRDPTGRPQRNTTLANLQGFRAMTVVGETRKASHQWSSDGLGSEVGGVTGRSQNLSTSYGLDSSVPTPQPCALNAQAWEDSQVRASSST
ncbi:hypothetical protein JKF63_04872 [Porcisia hertigi]|uniref:BAR domain-containing protein n=1 Tax=Porcisia hertigi TaxID=2761500 RepID=A0A836IHG7_9TRYP|nr:hypothetical protein JKF63_04872 [Porcisia hertigi]